MNGGSESGETIKVSYDDAEGRTLYVTEVDKNGIPVSGTAGFAYTVSVDHESVVIGDQNTTASVTITNTEKAVSNPDTILGNNSADSEKSGENAEGKEVKTGDETPIALYVLLLALSALLILFFLFRKARAAKKTK